MTFATQQATDFAHMLADFGESIVYRPASGGSRTITATVDRIDFEPLLNGGAGSPRLILSVLNDATDGISSDEIDTGGDKVDVAFREGEAATTRPITRLLGHDAVAMYLEVR